MLCVCVKMMDMEEINLSSKLAEDALAQGKILVPIDRSETKDQAERMAYADKPGEDLRLALENEKSGEKSLLQQENARVMEKMLEKFPHAFEEKADGRTRVLVIRDKSGTGDNRNFALTENGIFAVVGVSATNAYTELDIPCEAVNFFEVSRLMGDQPGNAEKEGNGVVMELVERKVIDQEKAKYTKAKMTRMKFVDDDTNGGTTPARFKEYLQRVNDNHKTEDLKLRAREEAADHSMSKLLD